MKNAKKAKNTLFDIIALIAIIGFSVAACDDGSTPAGAPSGPSNLSGTITISPNSNVVINTELTATYSGSEAVSYQWKKDGGNVGTNSNKFKPTAAGSYTVTVSAEGYKSKTSAAVDVTDPSLLILAGTIAISPNSGVQTGTELTATYSGSETVSYQWKKDGDNIGTNSNKFTPTAAGSYTVTVSAAGYNSKTSAAVTVTAAGSGGDPQTPEAMSTKTALEYLSDLKMGINLGNTLDAVSVPAAATETAWGNPAAAQAYFNGIKESGFDIVRIPVTWFGHIGSAPNYTVSQTRLARVAQVVGYAKTAGLKAIINIHHDGNYTEPAKGTWGFVDFKTATTNAAKKTEIQNEITKVWTQIAEYFKDYGDYLIFETLNEVHSGNWGFGASSAEQTILYDWNQAALSAIRATGGNNAKRYVAVPGLGSTEPSIVVSAYNANKLLPNDPENGTNRLIVSVHYYDPSRYTVAGVTDPQPLIHTWGSAAEKNELTHNFESLKSAFFDRGIAVYAGEWGGPTDVRASMNTTIKNTHLDYIGSVAKAARENGVLPIYWDDGGGFKIVERSNGKPKTGLWADTLAAIKTAINSATPPVPGTPSEPPTPGEVEGRDIVIGNWTWNAYNDVDNGGTSSITIAETPAGSGTLAISGDVVKVEGNYNVGFATWVATPDTATLTTLKTATTIKFTVKGDGKTYRISLPTSDITDYCYFETTFTTSGTETTKTINISSFAQPSWGTQKGSLNKTLLKEIQFQSGEGANGTFNLSIRNLTLE